MSWQASRSDSRATDLFSRYGIERPAYLSNSFNFTVTRSRDGRATIKVNSNRSVTEPFVTLLVEASWARGRLLREYTVLLDPPVFMPSQAPQTQAPVATPQSGAQTEGRIERQRTPQPEPAPAAEPSAQPSEPTRPAIAQAEPTEEPVAQSTPEIAASPGATYTVQRNDTLWRIASACQSGFASRRQPDDDRAVPRESRSIQRQHQSPARRQRAARSGLAEIEAIPTADASAEVARQAAEWSGGALPTETTETQRQLAAGHAGGDADGSDGSRTCGAGGNGAWPVQPAGSCEFRQAARSRQARVSPMCRGT